MLPATTNTIPRAARQQTREQEILELLTERREKLTVMQIAVALLTERENVRSAVNRLHQRKAIRREVQICKYKVGNSVAIRQQYRWYVYVEK